VATSSIQADLEQIQRGQSLSRERALDLMNRLVRAEMPHDEATAFLLALKAKTESVDEIVGFAQSLRLNAVKLPFVDSATHPALDVCGTGGGTTSTFNVSTTVSFVVAACGQRVAKHGNRSVSSRSGCFDALEALGVAFSSEPSFIQNSLEKYSLGFFFAPDFNPLLKNVAALRRSLGVTTAFNILGPLLNPLAVKKQVVGVFERSLLARMAEALTSLGAEETMVVHGLDGMDEISICAPTEVAHFKNGKLNCFQITPEECGLSRVQPSEIQGGSPEENAQTIIKVLNGEKSPRRDMVLINSAAALVVAGLARDFSEGVRIAALAIDSGRAFDILVSMRKLQS
jgi:anthranilate phosphoribosyltransferase